MEWARVISGETRRRGVGPLLSPVKEAARFQDRSLRGVLLGSVKVTGCHHADDCLTETGPNWSELRYCSRFAEPDAWHWTLADPEPLDEPIPMRGRQGLWRVEVEGAV
ncbi:hypothetical protein ER308_07370 [Egibacter rhizosphaerae]|uniref:Uncharacterized protein n=1 Tax=Egibacter rhizosphaerae TaxID=1670831 RepID=A0A411YDU4_9ACTN|nr:hypothetical protein [Egibacter rhizosphaerae]QBI19385.1 hypothetical protein ER308_07370 [Egibacter rhizosphaerae]